LSTVTRLTYRPSGGIDGSGDHVVAGEDWEAEQTERNIVTDGPGSSHCAIDALTLLINDAMRVATLEGGGWSGGRVAAGRGGRRSAPEPGQTIEYGINGERQL